MPTAITSIRWIRKTGEILWKFKSNGVVYSTPAVYKDIVYAGSCDGFVYALNLDGGLEWKFNTFSRIMNTSLVAVNDAVFFGTITAISSRWM